MKKIFEKLKGFSLAEVMLAMTIIGIISVITVPSMVASVKKHEYKTGVRKAHTIVTESFDSMKIDVNKVYETFNNDNKPAVDFRNTYAKYFGMKSVYAPSTYDGYYYPLNDTTTNVDPNLYNGGGFLARNGMMIMVGRVPVGSSSEKALLISVDINGPKRGNNQLGLDVYSFQVLPEDNILPVGANPSRDGVATANTTSFKAEDYCKTDISGNKLNGIACTRSAVYTAEYMNRLGDRQGPVAQNCDGTWNKSTQKCLCNHGKTWNEKTKVCECPEEYIQKGDNTCRRQVNGKECVITNMAGGEKCCEDCENQVWNDMKEEWECNNGAYLVTIPGEGKKCSACGKKIQMADGKCCPEGVNSLDAYGFCDCSPKEWGMDIVANVFACVDKCTTEQTRNRETGLCECKNGGKFVVNKCCPLEIALSNGMGSIKLIEDSIGTDCVYDCGEGKYNKSEWDPQCECSDEATWVQEGQGGVCKCNAKPNSTYKQGKCVCNEGYEEKDGACICQNGSPFPDQNCGCPAEKGLVGGNSASDPCKCNDKKGFGGAINAEGECECTEQNTIKQGGECICDASKGFTKNSSGKCECDTSRHFLAGTGPCQCDMKNGWYPQGTGEEGCKCNGTVGSDGSCQERCSLGATWNESKQQCECNATYAKLSSDGTTCTCKAADMFFDEGINDCKCPNNVTPQYTNIEEIDGQTVCPFGGNSCGDYPGQISDTNNGGICICLDGTGVDGSKLLPADGCKCPAGYYEDPVNPSETAYYEGAKYQQIQCINDNCNSSGGTWTSSGGSAGTCDCMEGMNPDSNNICGCMGQDVEYIATAKTDATPADYCICKSSKLTYTKTGDTYGCIPVSDTFDIENEEDLQSAKQLSGNYTYSLKNDVDVESNWTPWGTAAEPFTGSFEGNGRTITIENDILSGDDYTGLFGFTAPGCTIQNVDIVINGNIEGKAYVGALVGFNNCTIEHVTVSAKNISGEYALGGFVGANNGQINYATIANANINQKTITTPSSAKPATADTTIPDDYKAEGAQKTAAGARTYAVEGGFAGVNFGTITYANVKSSKIATADAVETSAAGGFVGENRKTIESCSVDASTQIGKTNFGSIYGGFAGVLSNGSLTKFSYTQANFVKGYEKTGGFAGTLTNGTISKSYTSVSTITSSNIDFPAYGFIGVVDKESPTAQLVSQDCFYNSAVGDAPCGGEGLVGTYHPQTTVELKEPNTYICAGWNDTDSKNKWYYPTANFPEIVPDKRDETTTCRANNNYEKASDHKCLYCGIDEYFDGENCFAPRCATGDVCPAGQHLDAGNNCVACEATQTWDEVNKVCKCADDMEPNGMGGCKCSDANAIYTNKYTTGEQRVCISCGEGAIKDQPNETCNCIAAYSSFDYDTDACVLDCPQYYAITKGDTCEFSPLIDWNNDTKTATCSSGTAFDLKYDIDLYLLSKCANEVANWTQGKTFNVAQEIDMSTINPYTPANLFEGTFDGHSNFISNLTINLPAQNDVGFFRTVSNANTPVTIQRVKFSNFSVTGQNNVGALIGTFNKTTGNTFTLQNNVLQSGTVTGAENVGGLIGYANITNATVLQAVNNIGASTSLINLVVTGNNAGGFAGYLNNTALFTLRRQSSYVKINGAEAANCTAPSGKAGLLGNVSNTANLSCPNTGAAKNTSNIATLYCPIP